MFFSETRCTINTTTSLLLLLLLLTLLLLLRNIAILEPLANKNSNSLTTQFSIKTRHYYIRIARLFVQNAEVTVTCVT